MKTQQNAFYLFLSLTRGSWRNAIFIECKNKCSKECAGWLMTTDTEGVPMLYPVSLFEEKADVVIDKTECAAVSAGKHLKRYTTDGFYGMFRIGQIAAYVRRQLTEQILFTERILNYIKGGD